MSSNARLSCTPRKISSSRMSSTVSPAVVRYARPSKQLARWNIFAKEEKRKRDKLLYFQLRYQKCLDAHPPGFRNASSVNTPGSGRGLGATLKSFVGTLTGRKNKQNESWNEALSLQVCNKSASSDVRDRQQALRRPSIVDRPCIAAVHRLYSSWWDIL